MTARQFSRIQWGYFLVYTAFAAVATFLASGRTYDRPVSNKFTMIWFPVVLMAGLGFGLWTAFRHLEETPDAPVDPSSVAMLMLLGTSFALNLGSQLEALDLDTLRRCWAVVLSAGSFALGFLLPVPHPVTRSKFLRRLSARWRPLWLLLTGAAALFALFRPEPGEAMILIGLVMMGTLALHSIGMKSSPSSVS